MMKHLLLHLIICFYFENGYGQKNFKKRNIICDKMIIEQKGKKKIFKSLLKVLKLSTL